MPGDLLSMLSPEQLLALTTLNQAPEQNELIQQEMQRGLAMQQPDPRRYTTGGGATFGALGDVLRAGGGVLREVDARKRLQSQRQATGAARQQLLASILKGTQPAPVQATGPSSSPAAMVPGLGDLLHEPTDADKARALAETIRGKKEAAIMALASGDPILSKVGGLLSGEAETAQRQDFERQQTQAQQTFAAGEAEKNRQAENWASVVNPLTGAVTMYNRKTGQTRQMGGGAPAAGGLMLKPKDELEMWGKFGQGISPYQGRANLQMENQKRLQAAERLETLILGPGGDIQNLTPQQVREASTALANLISSGSMSLQQIEELTPQSMAGQFAQVKQRIMNEPMGADAQGFLRNMLETAAREKGLITKQIQRGQMAAVPQFIALRQRDPEKFDSMLRAVGLDPTQLDENGLVKAAPVAAPAKEPGPAEERVIGGKRYVRNAAGKWEEAG